jgi:hypothetical protein
MGRARFPFLIALILVVTGCSAAAQAPAAPKPPRTSSNGQVYLLRGLIDVFSQGMDELAEKLRRRGIVSTVANHSSFETLAVEAIAKYRAGNRGPIIIAGHSLGADDAMHMAGLLNEARVPVALVVGFGPTLQLTTPANVARAVNYYQSNSMWHGMFSPGPGFRGQLVNINLDDASDITHFNIEKIGRLHDQTITRIMAIMGSRRAPATPATAQPAHAASPASAPSNAN